jgi:hypothetical protein
MKTRSPIRHFTGGTAAANFNGAPRSLTALAHDSLVGDTLTWVKSSHTMKFGVFYNFSKVYQNGRSTYAGLLAFNTNRPNSTGQAFGMHCSATSAHTASSRLIRPHILGFSNTMLSQPIAGS